MTMKTRLYIMAVMAMVALPACDDIQFGDKENEAIKVYLQDTGTEMTDGSSVILEKFLGVNDSIVFCGYVENVSVSDVTLQVRVEYEDSNIRHIFCGNDGEPLSADSVYDISGGAVSPGVITVFSARVFPMKDTTLKEDTKVTYTFYAKEFPTKAVKIDVIYRYEQYKVKHGIKVYQGDVYEYEGVELANDTSIVVDDTYPNGVNFSGYVENIVEDYVNMKVKVKMKSDGATQMLVPGADVCLPPSDDYTIARDVLPEDIIGFTAICEPYDRSVAADYEAVYTFYTEQYPEDTVVVNVTFRYVPEKQ